jgi:hypothetical protein
MKYFTPERYLRLGNLTDEPAFLAAQRDWEQAVAGYKDQLRRIRKKLPAGLGKLVDSVYLHDARVLDMWQGRRSRFTITLLPESAPGRFVILAYSLVKAPQFAYGVLPAEVRSHPVAWLYDELEVEQGAAASGGRRGRRLKAFRHNILLSNGWEITLRFRNVSVTRPVALLPGASDEGAARVGVARSA